MGLHVAVVEITGARDIEAPGDDALEAEITIGVSETSAGSPVGVQGKFFRLIADADCRYSVGINPTANPISRPLPAGQIWYVGPLQGGELVSVIQR